LKQQNLPYKKLAGSAVLAQVIRETGFRKAEDFYVALGSGKLQPSQIVKKVIQRLKTTEVAEEEAIPLKTSKARPAASDSVGIKVKGVDDVLVRVAKCCTPVPGDSIIGFVTRGGGVSVHREDCTNAEDLNRQPQRMVPVSWSPTAGSVFLVAIQVEALDRHRLLSDVTRVLSDERVNILSATVTTTRDRVAVSRFTFEMADPKHLGHLLGVVRKVEGVYDAYRVTSGA
jgi:GTP diphosphokinase / guanosine-3',5'-bis(diphosphate) 3'-diphosphatase